jgi:hypothetical protein
VQAARAPTVAWAHDERRIQPDDEGRDRGEEAGRAPAGDPGGVPGVDPVAQQRGEWLATLLRDGPHPRQVIAGKLGVSIAGLARGGVTEALTTAQIKELLQAPPQWLVQERATQAEVREEQIRVKNRDAGRAAMAAERERQEGTGGSRR